MNEPHQIPRAKRTGKLRIGGIELDCYVVETSDGVERVLSQRGVLAHLDTDATSAKNAMISRGVTGSVVEQIAASVLSMLPEDRRATHKPIRSVSFLPVGAGKPINGFRAEDVIALCDLILEADDAGVLIGAQSRFTRRAMQVIRACARVGIVALVDEATGYQVERGPEDLRRALDRYLTTEAHPWERRFPSEFFLRIAELRKSKFDPRNPAAGFGTIIADVVYSRMLPGVLPALRELNPRDENGRRAKKHHQHLSEFGKPVLDEHVRTITAFARAAFNEDEFMRLVDRYSPRSGTQYSLPTGHE